MRRRWEESIPEFTERAQFSYDRLSPQTKLTVDRILESMVLRGIRSIKANKIKGFEQLYIARVSNSLRIIFRYEDDVFTILDIVTHDQLRRLNQFYS